MQPFAMPLVIALFDQVQVLLFIWQFGLTMGACGTAFVLQVPPRNASVQAKAISFSPLCGI